MESAIWGLIGTAVGAFSSIGTTWLSTRNSLKLQNQNAQDQRAEVARAFQRQTLLELQEAILDELRLIGRAHIEDCAAYNKSGNWGSVMFSEEVNEGIRLAHRRVVILSERVTDESLRKEVAILLDLMIQALFEKTYDDAKGGLDRMSTKSYQVLGNLGTVLRKHY